MPISWKDPAKALTKLYPAQGGGDNDDDDDDATDTGSFFNFFETTDDPLEVSFHGLTLGISLMTPYLARQFHCQRGLPRSYRLLLGQHRRRR